jgi:hypothetical protein
MDLHDREWGRKGATLSDKTARQEYGPPQDSIWGDQPMHPQPSRQ